MRTVAAAWPSGTPARTARTLFAVSCGVMPGVTWSAPPAWGRSADHQACVPSRDRRGVRGGVQCECDARLAFEQPGGLSVPDVVGVPGQHVGQVRQACADLRGERVAGGADGGLVHPCPAVAQAGAGDLAELSRIGQAGGQRVLGDLLAARVTCGDSSDMLRSGLAGTAITPARPRRTGLACPAGAQVVEGDPLRPPGSGAAVLAPGVQEGADAADGAEVTVDGDPSPQGLPEKTEYAAYAVGGPEVGMPARETG